MPALHAPMVAKPGHTATLCTVTGGTEYHDVCQRWRHDLGPPLAETTEIKKWGVTPWPASSLCLVHSNSPSPQVYLESCCTLRNRRANPRNRQNCGLSPLFPEHFRKWNRSRNHKPEKDATSKALPESRSPLPLAEPTCFSRGEGEGSCMLETGKLLSMPGE